MNDTITLNTTPAENCSVIMNISNLNWTDLNQADISATAWAYYYFSIQFRENLLVAHRLYPHDPAVGRLMNEECATDNLSPWPGVARAGEKLDHDEFMKRVLTLSPINPETQQRIESAGWDYLSRVRAEDDSAKAASIASYEDGGLEQVFKAMLRCQIWDTPLLQGFQHFLVKHIGFDSNPDHGHGALIRHLASDERTLALWREFYNLLVVSVPHLVNARSPAIVD